MKLFTDDMQTVNAGTFSFSGVRPEKLGAVEYTLVTLVMDRTGSVNGFETELLRVKQAVVEACRKEPRAEYLMFRSVEFNERIDEIHGFVELVNIDPSKYRKPDCAGSTALFDAMLGCFCRCGCGRTNDHLRFRTRCPVGEKSWKRLFSRRFPQSSPEKLRCAPPDPYFG
jgi:hypothetical protein